MKTFVPSDLPARPSRMRRACGQRAGFTLVEVCLSVGIMTFVIVPLLGLMAFGLTQVSTNIDKSAAVYISQQTLLEARQTPFSTLTTSTTPYQRYFTALGDPVAAGSANIVYTANVSVTAPSLPGGDTTQSTLRTLTVQVRKTPGGHDIAKNRSVATFVSMVSCNDLDNSGSN